MSVQRLIQFLNTLTPADFKNDAVDHFLKDQEFEEETFLPFAHFLEETYGRNLVYKNANYELLVLTWLPGNRTPIHDHADQRCWMFVESGELTFKNYKVMSKTEVKPVGECEVRKARQRVYIDDELGLHSIANLSTKPAISVHLYAGPVPSCQIYDPIAKRFEKTELTYLTEGVWSPELELLDTPLFTPNLN